MLNLVLKLLVLRPHKRWQPCYIEQNFDQWLNSLKPRDRTLPMGDQTISGDYILYGAKVVVRKRIKYAPEDMFPQLGIIHTFFKLWSYILHNHTIIISKKWIGIVEFFNLLHYKDLDLSYKIHLTLLHYQNCLKYDDGMNWNDPSGNGRAVWHLTIV